MTYCGIIWMLHRVAPALESHTCFFIDKWFRISPDYLDQIISMALGKGYRFVSLDQFLINKKARKGSRKDIVITIDDGWHDIYQYAYPIFKKYNIPFTFYVATDLIQFGFDGCSLPEMDGTAILMDLIGARDRVMLRGREWDCRSDKQKQDMFDYIWNLFEEERRITQVPGRAILDSLLTPSEIDFEKYKAEYVCSVEILRAMAKDPLCTIGSHAKSHLKLTEIVSDGALEDEFLKSKHILEEWLGIDIRHFCYPYGKYNGRVIDMARSSYQSAVAIFVPEHYSHIAMAGDNNYCLPRILVRETDSDAYMFGQCSISK